MVLLQLMWLHVDKNVDRDVDVNVNGKADVNASGPRQRSWIMDEDYSLLRAG